jgi:hypothetical protein
LAGGQSVAQVDWAQTLSVQDQLSQGPQIVDAVLAEQNGLNLGIEVSMFSVPRRAEKVKPWGSWLGCRQFTAALNNG